MRKRPVLGVALSLLVVVTGEAMANAIYWAEWNLKSPGWPGSASGAITFPTQTVPVFYTGELFNAYDQGNWNEYPGTYTLPGVVDNPPSPPDISIQLVGNNLIQNTLSFSRPIFNPVLAIQSLGNSGDSASYVFDQPFTLLSQGPGHWGGGTLAVSGQTLIGWEGNGIIQFAGFYSSLSWKTPDGENYHMFTVGAPEPSPPNTILYVGSNTPSNTLDLSSGAHAYLKTYVGFTEESTNNNLSVRNAGTLLSNDDSLTVGEGGSGNRMVVSNGATVLSATGYIGAAATASNNAVLVTGAGSVWQNTGLLHVGYLGSNNSLTIADGGTVAASGIVLGLTNGASGVLNIGRLGENDAGGTVNTPSINMGSVDSLINFNQTNTITLASSIGGLGSLHQNGTGTTIMTGLNTYSGVSVINAGTLQIGDGGTNGTIGSGNITNNSRLVINRSDSYIITNNIFGTGELIQMGGSPIVIGGGGGSGGSGGSGGGGSGATTIGNVIGGSSGLTKTGDGTLILTADNTYTGTTTIAGGTLQLGDETPAGSTGPGNIANNATLAIKRNNTFILGNLITGSGQVRQTGTGTTVMTGSNSYTGPTTVTNGSLLVNGSATSSTFTARDNGVLGGSGIIGAANIIKGGTLAPGSSIGSLHTGALCFSDGSALAIELDSAGTSADLVVVSGGLSLDGLVSLTLNDIAASPSPFALDTTFSLLNYSGSWNGGLFTYGSTQLANGATFSAGLNQWRIVYNALSGGQNLVSDHQPGGAFVNIKSVPEPSTYALLLMTGAGALWWARRRR